MAPPPSVILECPYCKASVACKHVAHHTAYNPEEDPAPFRTFLLECPRCTQTLVAGSYQYPDDVGGAETPSRLWPVPPKSIDWAIPQLVRESLLEADICFNAGAFGACAVMCGRALEAVCRHFGSTSMLGRGLRELKDKEVIDGRLFEWATELQKSRNLSAHPSGEKVARPDAEDLLNFTTAICEYVFVLTSRFESFKKRRRIRLKKQKKANDKAE